MSDLQGSTGFHLSLTVMMMREMITSRGGPKDDFMVTQALARLKYSAMIRRSCSLKLLQGETGK